MYNIIFYRDRRGKEPTNEFVKELKKRDSGTSKKVDDYITVLRQGGLGAGMPYIRHLQDEIWEVRPKSYRLLFAPWENDTFIILHHFLKTTTKTPQKEIDQAKRNLADYRERYKRS